MRYIFPLIFALSLSACAAPSAVIDKAVESGITVEDAQRAARIFDMANNPAGKRCMDYIASKFIDIRSIRTEIGEDDPGPLTAFAISHSAIETIQNRDLGAFGDACGALRMQVRGNVTAAAGVVRTLLGGI